MKKILFLLLLIPCLMVSQEYQEPLVVQNVMLTVLPGHTKAFETAVAAHNKKYHAPGTYQSNVFSIGNGTNTGKYIWNMGPLPWSALDGRPTTEDGHDADWDANVLPHLSGEVDVNYWRFHAESSNFSKEFTLDKLSVFIVDIKHMKNSDFMDKVLKKVIKVYKEKMPEQIYGMYTNEMSNANGLDFAWVNFFDSFAWMGKEDTFPKYFEEVHGEGSFKSFLADVEATTNGQNTELWVYRKDLSGTTGVVPAASGN